MRIRIPQPFSRQGCVISFACTLLMSGTLTGAPAPQIERPRTFAVLVGVSEYADKRIKPRPMAEKDVAALHKLFTDPAHSVDPTNVRLLLGKKATKANFLTALEWVAREAKPADLVLVTIIGQGAPLGRLGKRRCYFMIDSTFSGRDEDAVASEEIDEALENLRAKRLTAFIDVNFTGFVSDRPIAEPTLGESPYKEFLGDDGTERHLPLPGRVAFVSSNGLDPSPDRKDHGLFTTVLLEALGGKADAEGGEPDGFVTVDEVRKYLGYRLPALARAGGKTALEERQLPVLLVGPVSRYALTKNPKADAKIRKRLDAFDRLVLDDEITDAGLIGEGRDYLMRMPTLKKRQEVRKLYQAVADGKVSAKALVEKRAAILAGMKLDQTSATAFADTILEVTGLLKKKYVADVNQGKMVGWAISELFGFVEEKIPVAIEAKMKEVQGLGTPALRTLLIEARTALGRREDLDDLKHYEFTLTRMLQRIDRNMRCFAPASFEPCCLPWYGLTGIGVQLRREVETKELLVVTVIKRSPAHQAGLRVGDVITEMIRKVDSWGEALPRAEKTLTRGLDLEKAVNLILGKWDTSIVLMIRREGVKEPFAVDIKRGRVELETIFGHRRKVASDENLIKPLPK